MASITTRGSKGTPLTHNEVDANFTNLNSDKLDTAGIALGSAASPTIKFTGDTNTGIYSPGADQVAVSIGGTERLRIDTVGRLLKGNLSSLAIGAIESGVQIVGPATTNSASLALARINNDSTAGPNIFLAKSRGSSLTPGVQVTTNDILGAITFCGDNGTNLSLRGGEIRCDVDTGTVSATSMPGRILFFTTSNGSSSPTERMRITSAGNVGIGTSSPATTLNINGTCRVQQASSFAGINIRNDNDSSSVATTSYLDASNNLGTIDGHIFFEHLTSGGSNVTISTTPAGDRTVDRRVTRLVVGSSGTTTLNSVAATAPFIAQINSSEVARINGSGRLLIGTSADRSSRLGTNSFNSSLQIESDAEAAQSITRWSADASSSRLHLQKGRGTIASPSAVTQEDILGEISFSGYDSANMSNGARIQAAVDGAPGANDMPGRLVFLTTADTASSPTERLRITQQGVIAYNQAAPATCNTSATITVADLTNRIITSTTAAAVTMTLPTGTDTEGAFSGLYNNFTFEFCVINTGSNTLTVTTNTGWTLTNNGNMAVAAGTTSRFAARRTGANTWSLYCVG